jgi:hypothetical protein
MLSKYLSNCLFAFLSDANSDITDSFYIQCEEDIYNEEFFKIYFHHFLRLYKQYVTEILTSLNLTTDTFSLNRASNKVRRWRKNN